MNSFNHYAYGAVTDWVYTTAAGIRTIESAPGYAKVEIAPHPDERLGCLEANLDTRHGHIRSRWEKQDDSWRFEIDTPVDAKITIAQKSRFVPKGTYIFYAPRKETL